MQIILQIFRKGIKACCLVPASFLHYSSVSRWTRAVRHPKPFFTDIIDHAEDLIEETSAKGRCWGILVAAPLWLALRIQQTGSVRRGLTDCLHQRYISPSDALLPPAPIELIPGLVEGTPEALAKADALLCFLQGAEEVSIAEHAQKSYGEDVFAGHTVAVLAHWDKEGRVDPYVRNMLEHFRSLGWKTILTSAAPIHPEDVPLTQVDGIVYRTCPGYDFTSWKAALTCFPSLWQAKEVILCNDSVFAPVGSYQTMHETMNGISCDFWGATASRDYIPHLQSFHLVFRSAALQHPALQDFFRKVPLSDSRELAINLEIRFALWLARHGLRPAAFISLSSKVHESVNPTHSYWKNIIHAGVPLVKRDFVSSRIQKKQLDGLISVLRDKGYPVSLLFAHVWRMGLGLDLAPQLCQGERTGTWPPDVLALQDDIDLGEELALLAEDRPPLGVFLHVSSSEVVQDLPDWLENLPRSAHMFVSTGCRENAEQIRLTLNPMKFAKLEVRTMPDRGGSIAPLLVGFADELENYPLIVCLHTAVSAKLPRATADIWRGNLFSALVGSRDRVHRLESLFASHPNLGMICPPPLDACATPPAIGEHYEAMCRLLVPYRVTFSPTTAIDFPVGSMFWCRSAALRPWLNHKWRFEDFGPGADNPGDSLTPALERLLLFGCGLAGLRWGRVAPVGYERYRNKAVSQPRLCGSMQESQLISRKTPSVPQFYVSLEKDRKQLGVDAVIRPAAVRPELVLILPSIHPRSFSGGPNTAFLFAAEVAKAGYGVHCLSEMAPTCPSDVLRAHLCELIGGDGDFVDRFRVSCLQSRVDLHENDRLMATAWWTTRTAGTLGLRMKTSRFAYFIQDFEPLFYPWSEDHAGAMLSYGRDMIPIINEPCLAQTFFMTHPGRFEDSAFRENTQVFMPAVDRRYFYPEKRQGRHTLLFYARPSAPRNLYHFGLEAIYRMVRDGVITALDWDVHCMGDDGVPPIDFGYGVVSRTLPWMGFADYAARIRQASVGLSLMLSPHTSYMPLELAASGVPVVTTTYLNKSAAFLNNLSPHIIGVEPAIDAIADGLREAVRRAEREEGREDMLNAPGSWPEAFASVMPRFLRFMETGQ